MTGGALSAGGATLLQTTLAVFCGVPGVPDPPIVLQVRAVARAWRWRVRTLEVAHLLSTVENGCPPVGCASPRLAPPHLVCRDAAVLWRAVPRTAAPLPRAAAAGRRAVRRPLRRRDAQGAAHTRRDAMLHAAVMMPLRRVFTFTTAMR
jgi:hypothetical protein